MRRSVIRQLILGLLPGISLLAGGCEKGRPEPPQSFAIWENGRLALGYGMGANLGSGPSDWVRIVDDAIRMDYPDGQNWGAVSITVGGDPVDPPRPSEDFSGYSILSVELRGESGGDSVLIGIKDCDDPDTGQEARLLAAGIPAGWTTYEFELDRFTTADLTRLYVPVEFVFVGRHGQAVSVRDVRYLP